MHSSLTENKNYLKYCPALPFKRLSNFMRIIS